MNIVEEFRQLCQIIEEVRPPEAGDSFLKFYLDSASDFFGVVDVDLYYSTSRVSIYPTYCEVSLGFFSIETLEYYSQHGDWPVFSSFSVK